MKVQAARMTDELHASQQPSRHRRRLPANHVCWAGPGCQQTPGSSRMPGSLKKCITVKLALLRYTTLLDCTYIGVWLETYPCRTHTLVGHKPS